MDKATLDLDNPEFRRVWDLIEQTSASVFMTGKAGTGKSTFLRYITAHTRKKHVILAPTGIAAVNAGGQTLHSFFHIPLRPLLPDDAEFAPRRLRNRMKYSRDFLKLLRELELIVIDEISMVRADVIDFVDKILRHFSGRAGEPFGGKQLLMVGDIFQLEPVVTADAREILRRAYPNFYFFSAKVFADTVLVPVELRKVYRQTDSAFVSLLDRVRDGVPTDADISLINSRVSPGALAAESAPAPGAPMSMTIATRREIVDFINSERLGALTAKAYKFEAAVEGDFPETSYPADKVLTLKEGAQVVFIRNDQERRWVNGTLGRVDSLSADRLTVCLENGQIHTVEPEAWSNVHYRYNDRERTVEEDVLGTFRQFPVKLAWALTIHKSQGLTFSRLRVDVGRGAFTGGQTYVALSRATSLEGLSLATPLRRSDIYVSPEVRRFALAFNSGHLFEQARHVADASRAYAEAARLFDERRFGTAYDALAKAVGLDNRLQSRAMRLMATRKLYALAEVENEVKCLRNQLAERDTMLSQLADEFVQLGLTSLDEGWDYTAALANFDKALHIFPSHYEALLGRSRALEAAGDSEAALDALATAAALLPKRHEAFYRAGAILLSRGDTGQSLVMLKKARKAAPSRAEVYDLLADACEAAGDPDQSARYRAQAGRLRSRRKK